MDQYAMDIQIIMSQKNLASAHLARATKFQEKILVLDSFILNMCC